MGEIEFGGVGRVVRPFVAEGTGAEVPSRLVKASGLWSGCLSLSFIVGLSFVFVFLSGWEEKEEVGLEVELLLVVVSFVAVSSIRPVKAMASCER